MVDRWKIDDEHWNVEGTQIDNRTEIQKESEIGTDTETMRE